MGILIKVGCGGVCLDKLHPMMQPVLSAVALIWGSEDPVITSTWDGVHSSSSWHYFCRALDFRFPVGITPQLAGTKLRAKLGKDYDVVVEGTHIHIEYDPD